MTTDKEKLYEQQNKILEKVFCAEKSIGIPGVILAGGTALARCYLDHRISYDLDFFVPFRFSPELLSISLGKAGVILENTHIENGGKFVAQLHADCITDDGRVNISFIEDTFEGMFVTERTDAKGAMPLVVTEKIEGLYHRKLRTVSGSGYGPDAIGARQTARDLFDLYVLGKVVAEPSDFVSEINKHGANFPTEAFCSQAAIMPWDRLIDEFCDLELSEKYATVSLEYDVKPFLLRTINNLLERDKHGNRAIRMAPR